MYTNAISQNRVTKKCSI